MSMMVGVLLVMMLASMALAASPGCTAVNGGQLNYSGPSPTAQLGVVIGQFYPGDQLFMTYTTNTPKAGVVLDLILTSLSVNTIITGSTGTTHSQTATVGALLPIGAKAGITDATAGINPRNVVMTVTCSPAAAPTTLVVTSSPILSTYGQAVQLSATLSSIGGQPNGSVVFAIDGVAQPAVTISNGVAVLNTTAMTAGGHAISASYAGNSNFTASSGTLFGGQGVLRAATTTTFGSSAATSPFGSNVTFTATVAAVAPGSGIPDGSVIFTIDGMDQAPVTLSGGVASLTTSTLGVGNHYVAARYAGNTNYNASLSGLGDLQVITKATTTTALSPTASTTFGQAATFRATVSSAAGTPTGSVVFTIDGAAQAPVALTNGVAEFSVSSLAVGSHTVGASYGGTANLLASSGTLPAGHAVTLISTTTGLSGPGAIGFGNTATITASVTSGSGTPTGSIVFTIDGVSRAPVALSNGGASVTLAGLGAGTHSVSAAYAGTASFGASIGALSGGQVVSKSTTVTAVGPITAVTLGQSINVVASVSATSGVPDGSVVFTVDGTALDPVSLVNGQASAVIPGLGVGSHSMIAAYSGAANFTASTGTSGANVNKAASSLVVTSAANPSVTGQGLSFSATAGSGVGVPSGAVVFTIDGVDQNPVPLANGVATISRPGMGVGNHTVSASYQGNANLLSSSASLPGGQTVARAATTLSLSSDPASAAFGATVSFTAQISPVAPGAGMPTGNIVFSVDGAAQPAQLLSNGSATITRANLAVGSHTVTALYVGDGDFGPANGTLAGGQGVVAAATTTSIGFSPASPRLGDAATITATVATATGVPTGSVIFTINGSDQSPISLVNGAAQFSLPNLSVGSYTLGARFAGTTSYSSSSASDVTMTVAAATTTTTVSAAPASIKLGETTTLSASVSAAHGTPSGTVEFRSDGTLLGTAALNNGAASLSTAVLTRGDHAISVNYLGSTDHAASADTLATPVAVAAGTTTLAVAANPQPATFGQVVTVSATASAIAGTPSGAVIFTVDGVAQPPASLSSGVASISLPALEAGSHTVQASYGGSSDHLAASATLAGGIVIDKARATVGLVVTPSTPAFGDTVGITATLTSPAGMPSGDVVFVVDGVPRPPVTLVSGVASISLPGLAAGTHGIEARFGGDSRLEPATTTLSAGVEIAWATTSMTIGATPDPARFGDAVSFTASVAASSGSAAGLVIFNLDGVAQAPVQLNNGAATLTTSGLMVGPHTVTAAFAAQGNFGASSATLAGGFDIDVAATRTVVAGPSTAIVVGETARFIATVGADHGIPGGSVIFTVDGAAQAPMPLSQGEAVLDVVFQAAGHHTVTATYTGAANFAPSGATLAGGVIIGKAGTQAALTVPQTGPFGSAVTARVDVSSVAGTPAGSVTFHVDGTAAGSAVLSGGSASLVLPRLPAGDHEITATYGGDLNFAVSAAASANITIQPAAVTMSVFASAANVTVGQPVSISVSASSAAGPATGSVVITIGTVDHVVPLNQGAGVVTLSSLAAGTYNVTATYAGTAEFAAQTVALSTALTVNPAPTDIQVSANLPRSVAGEAFAGSFSAYGGVGPYGYAVTDGALPPGLSLDSATGAIAGTPSAAGRFSWEVTATGVAGAPGAYAVRLVVLTPATITMPDSIDDAVYGVSYQGLLAATGGTSPISYAVTSGSLPPGLMLDAATGSLSGTPSQLGSTSFTVTATDANGFVGSQVLSLTVAAPSITISGSFPDAVAAAPYGGSVSVSGGTAPYSFSLDGALPPGLTLDHATGSVSGTPTQAGSFDFAVLAADADGFGGRLDVSIEVDNQPIIVLPTTLAAPRQNRPYAQALTATGGTGSYSYAVVSGSLPAGIALNSSTGRLTGTPTGSGSSTFEISATDASGLVGSRSYTLDVQAAAVLVVDAVLDPVTAGVAYGDAVSVSGGAAPYTFAVLSGALPTGILLDRATGAVAGTTLVPGTYAVVLDIADADGETVTATLTLQVAAPAITVQASVTDVDFGDSVSGTIAASGGTAPYTYAVTSGALPSGVTVDANTGDVTGTATEAGTFSAAITGTDANGFAGTSTLALSIAAPTLSLGALPDDVMVGQAVSETLSVNGGRAPYSFAVIGNLPAGLTLDPDTGLLTGTPLAVGQRSFTITATDADGFGASASYTIDIVSNIGDADLPGAPAPVTAGTVYGASLAATGGAAPLTYAITAGSLPAGLALDPVTGELSGTTMATGSFSFEVTVTGADSRINSATYMLASNAPTLSVADQPAAAEGGVAYNEALVVSGGTAPYTFVVRSGSLPAGLVLDSVGQISGTPTEAGAFGFVVTVTDDNGFAADLSFNLDVAAPSIDIVANIPDGRIGQAYAGTVAANGGVAPLRYALTSGALPDGLVLDGDTGALSGTPMAAGLSTFTITVTDANGFAGAGTQSLLVATNVGTTTLPATIEDAVAGEAYAETVVASGGAAPYGYAVTAGNLPPGLSLSPTTGVIAGTPTEAGDFSFGITVTDDNGLINHQNYQLTITAPEVEVVASPPPAEAGEPYSATISVTGGTSPYDFVLEDAPPGITIDNAGRLSGTPSRAGIYNFAVVVTDANGFRAVAPLTLTVAAAPVVLALPADIPDAIEGEAYAAALMPTNAVGAVQYGLANGTQLPPGLQLDTASGTIDGTPTAPGTYSFDVHAADANGNTGDASYSIVVAVDLPPPAEATTIDLDVGAGSLVVGESVTLDIVVTAGSGHADEGLVTIVDTVSGQTVATGAIAADGTASFTVAFDSVSNRDLVASYAGTSRFGASDSAGAAVAVAPAATSVVLSGGVGPVAAGTPIVLVANASRQSPATGAAGPGAIVFSLDGVDVQTVAATSGGASHTLILPPGQHQVGARFEPTSPNDTGSSSGPSTVAVTASTTTGLAAPDGDVVAGQSLTFTATVTATATGVPMTGDITFSDNGVAVATVPLSNGEASFTMVAGAGGNHAITAAFSGDAYYGASTSPTIAHRVVPAPGTPLLATTTMLTTGNAAPQVGEQVVLTATVVADGVVVPTGTVTFVNGTTGVALGTTVVDGTGVAVLTLSFADAQQTTVTAAYSGDIQLLGSVGTVTLTPAAAGTEIALSSSASTVLPGEAVVLTAEVRRDTGGLVDAGTVAFLADGTAFAHVQTNGAASVEVTSDPLSGPTQFTAQYTPSPGSADSAATSPAITVNTALALPVVTVTANVANDGGASGTVTISPPAGVTQVPSGQVTLSAGAAEDQVLTLTSGGASFVYPAGSFINTGVTFSASYTGDVQFLPASGSVTTQPAGTIPTQTVVEVSQTEILPGQPVVATVHVIANPAVADGYVDIIEDGRRTATVRVVDGIAIVTLHNLDAGENTVSARYLGTAEHAPSVANAVSITVLPAPGGGGSLSLALATDVGAIFSAGQVINVTAQVGAIGGPATNIVLWSRVNFSCPRTGLAAGETMICTGVHIVTSADIAAGQVTLAATAVADNMAAVDASDTLLSAADAVSETFETLSDNFVADRARVLGNAIPLPDILLRRSAGTRAGTVQASNSDTGQVLAFSSSLAEWRNWAAAQAADGMALGMLDEPLPVNVWVDAQLSLHASADGDERWGRLGTVAVGADYLITDDILAGIMVQGDWTAETAANGDVSGSGFLVGPYVSIALNDNLSFDATVLYGRSSNTASSTLFGDSFSGNFDTTRLFGKAALTDYFEIDQLTVRPNATFMLTSESTADYTVTNGDGAVVTVPGGEHLQYQLTVGGSAEYAIALDNGATLTPMIGLDLGFNGALEDDGTLGGSALGRLTTGIQFETGAGLQLGLEFDTEIDTGGFSSAGARATIKGRF